MTRQPEYLTKPKASEIHSTSNWLAA